MSWFYYVVDTFESKEKYGASITIIGLKPLQHAASATQTTLLPLIFPQKKETSFPKMEKWSNIFLRQDPLRLF